MHAMVTELSTHSVMDGTSIESLPELVTEVNEFLAKGRWSPENVRVQFMVLPFGSGASVLVQAFVTHPAPSL